MTLQRVLLGALLLLLGAAALRDVARIGNDLPWRVMYDFQDFYCAGSVLDARQDPYTYEPLRTCEHRVGRNPSFRTNPSLAIPAPQPPYDFPPFMALSRLSYAAAQGWYAAAIVAAVIGSAIVLWRLGIPLDVALLALALGPGYLELDAGQIVPFAFLFLVATGWMLALRRDAAAGVFAALCGVEPHLGIAVALAVFFFVPRGRFSLIATAVGLAAIALVVAGPSGVATYATRVLWAQAASEVTFPPQYSLTYLLHAFGTPDALALALGTLSFCLFVAAGLVVAPRLAARVGRRELLAFLPAATAIMGGAYVHVVELCLAIPAALVLACFARGAGRSVAAAAACLLTVPWIAAWGTKKLFLACVFVCAALLYRLGVSRAFGIATVLAIAVALYLLELHPPWLPPAPGLPAASFAAHALVQTEWKSVARALDSHDPLWLAVKLPGWIGLAAVLSVALAESSATVPGPGRAAVPRRTRA